MAFQFKFPKNAYFEFSVLRTQACFICNSAESTRCMHVRTLRYVQFLCIFRIPLQWGDDGSDVGQKLFAV